VARDWGQGGGSAERDVDERDRVLRALATLAPRRRAVVVLRFYEDLPEATIAALLGISVGTVKSQLSRGLEQLRPMLGTQDGV
jgi:RNA polymerase sigma factor (sigma-70 family)